LSYSREEIPSTATNEALEKRLQRRVEQMREASELSAGAVVVDCGPASPPTAGRDG
jgi:hypothetical protein